MNALRRALTQTVQALTRRLQPRLRTWLREPVDPAELFEPIGAPGADSRNEGTLDPGDRQLLAAATHDTTMLRDQFGRSEENDHA